MIQEAYELKIKQRYNTDMVETVQLMSVMLSPLFSIHQQ